MRFEAVYYFVGWGVGGAVGALCGADIGGKNGAMLIAVTTIAMAIAWFTTDWLFSRRERGRNE